MRLAFIRWTSDKPITKRGPRAQSSPACATVHTTCLEKQLSHSTHEIKKDLKKGRKEKL